MLFQSLDFFSKLKHIVSMSVQEIEKEIQNLSPAEKSELFTDLLEEFEDYLDTQAALRSLKEEGENVDWETLKKELNLDV